MKLGRYTRRAGRGTARARVAIRYAKERGGTQLRRVCNELATSVCMSLSNRKHVSHCAGVCTDDDVCARVREECCMLGYSKLGER